MFTTPDQWQAMTDSQRYEALTRAEIQRDNAELLLLAHRRAAAAERQQEVIDAIRGKGGLHAARN